MLYPAVMGIVDPSRLTEPISRRMRGTHFEFMKAEVKSIDLEDRSVLTDKGAVTYDYLIVALGSTPDFDRVPGARSRTTALRSIDDAAAIRDRVTSALDEAAMLAADDPRRRHLLSFVVIGGATGSVLAAWLKDYIDALSGAYPSISRSEFRITLIERRERVFPDGDYRFSRAVGRVIASRGVEVRLNVEAMKIEPWGVLLSDGSRIESVNVFWDAGNRPAPVLDSIPDGKVTRHKGRIVVDQMLGLPRYKSVYFIGDNAAVGMTDASSKLLGFAPLTAEAAIQEGRFVGRQLAHLLSEKSDVVRNDQKRRLSKRVRPFSFESRRPAVSLGFRYGVVKLRDSAYLGLMGWIFWRAVHVTALSTGSKRIRMFLDWVTESVRVRKRLVPRRVPGLGGDYLTSVGASGRRIEQEKTAGLGLSAGSASAGSRSRGIAPDA
jgi:NADH dehydrogenase